MRSLLEIIAHGLILSCILMNSKHTQPSKTSQLATRDHCWDPLRKETSITGTSQEIHAMMQPTQG